MAALRTEITEDVAGWLGDGFSTTDVVKMVAVPTVQRLIELLVGAIVEATVEREE